MFNSCVPLRAPQAAAIATDPLAESNVRPQTFAGTRWWNVRRIQSLIVFSIAVIVSTSVGGAPPPSNIAPAILSFEGSYILGEYWEFHGTVDDEDVAACVVNFGGFMAGQSADVNFDGTFSLVITLDPDDGGLASAQAVDTGGLLSTLEERSIIQ